MAEPKHYKGMKEVTVNFTVRIPDDIEATEEQIREWIHYEIGYRASLSLQNPLVDDEIRGKITSVSIRREPKFIHIETNVPPDKKQ